MESRVDGITNAQLIKLREDILLRIITADSVGVARRLGDVLDAINKELKRRGIGEMV